MNFFLNRMQARARLAAGAAGLLCALGAAAHDGHPKSESADARQADAQAAPEAADQTGTELRKVGEARLKVMFWSVYDSRLYTPSGDYQQGVRPLRLDIEYLIDVKAEALVERTAKEWRSMGREHPRQSEWLAQLRDIWTNVKAGDVIGLSLDTQNHSTFFKNGERLGQIKDPEFGEQFVDIWLSPDTSRPDIRLGLLGKNQGD